MSLRIIHLEAENLKRLRAVDITPDGDLVIIAGRNGAGKTSVLDAIAWAIGGARMFSDSPDPVRHGEHRAEVSLDLGELLVTRTWTSDGKSKLMVTNANGVAPKSPQALLDSLIGALTFDPLAFAGSDAKTQRRQLLQLIDLPFDLDELDARRSDLFQERTHANREHKRLEAAWSSMPKPTAPAGGVSLEDAVAALTSAGKAKAANDEVRARYYRSEDALTEAVATCRRAEAAFAEAERALAAARSDVADWEREVAGLPADPDLDALGAAVSEAKSADDGEARAAEWERRKTEVEQQGARAARLTDQIEAIDAEKLAGLQAATMPIAGLSIDADGVLFAGVPLAQCSGAERLKVSLAIAMAANPGLRVIRITDGSLLDEANLEVVREMAAEHDMQVWIERVGSQDPGAIVIEDGMVIG